MASTRNKNTKGNYDLEQRSLQNHSEYLTYIHSQSGRPTQTMFPGNGLLQGRIAPTELSRNTCDIESFLYGIGSTNLVTPLSETNVEILKLKSLDIAKRIQLFVPDPIVVRNDERPFPL
jgi:hypothetical protein